MTNSDIPDFKTDFEQDSSEDKVKDAIIQIREPTSAGWIGKIAGVDPIDARNILDQLSYQDDSIVQRIPGEGYVRDDEELRKRRIQKLIAANTEGELKDHIHHLEQRIERYESEHDASTPAESELTYKTNPMEFAAWNTALSEIELYREALQEKQSSNR